MDIKWLVFMFGLLGPFVVSKLWFVFWDCLEWLRLGFLDPILLGLSQLWIGLLIRVYLQRPNAL
ncbi:hypothetical protein HanRHA438_Chr14g0648401 [Helianthus annuus]|nr:hypothetical protein HanRHA438_Chr14g0648401 [Helianthus annuus]